MRSNKIYQQIHLHYYQIVYVFFQVINLALGFMIAFGIWSNLLKNSHA